MIQDGQNMSEEGCTQDCELPTNLVESISNESFNNQLENDPSAF